MVIVSAHNVWLWSSYASLRSLLCSGNRAHRQLIGPQIARVLRSCFLFKRVHQVLYSVLHLNFSVTVLSNRLVDRVEEDNYRIGGELPTFSAYWQIVYYCSFLIGLKSIEYALVTCITAMYSTFLVYGFCTRTLFSLNNLMIKNVLTSERPIKKAPLPNQYETSDSRPVSRVLLRTAPCARAARSVGFARRRRPRSSDCSARDTCISLLAAPSWMPSCRCALEYSRQLGPFEYCSFS